jgi:hypothetical protein
VKLRQTNSDSAIATMNLKSTTMMSVCSMRSTLSPLAIPQRRSGIRCCTHSSK